MDQRIFLVIFIAICSYEQVLSVSQRLQAFENAIAEARPYLQDRRLRREDAYDIERRMLSHAFKKAMGQDILKLDVELEQNLRAPGGQHGKDENTALIQYDDLDEEIDGNPSSSTLKERDENEIEYYPQAADEENGSNENINCGLNDQKNTYNGYDHETGTVLEPRCSNELLEENKSSPNYLNRNLKTRESEGNPDEDDEDGSNFNRGIAFSNSNKAPKSLSECCDKDQKNFDTFQHEQANLWESENTHEKSNDMSNSLQSENENLKKNIGYVGDEGKEVSNFWHKDIHGDQSKRTHESQKTEEEEKTDFKFKTDENSQSSNLESRVLNGVSKDLQVTVSEDEYDNKDYIRDYGAHIFDKYDDLQNMSWTQWLVNHPNIYLYATKNFQVVSNILPKDANRSAIEEIVRNSAKLLQAQKDRLSQSNEQDIALKSDHNIPFNAAVSSFNKIGAAAKELSPADHGQTNLNAKDAMPAPAVGNNWDYGPESVHHTQNNVKSSKEPDQSDQFESLGASMDSSSQRKHNDESASNFQYRADSMPKEKRNPVWNNWPITNPATFNFGMKYKKDRLPPTLMVLDPMILQNLSQEPSTDSEEVSAPLQPLSDTPESENGIPTSLEQEDQPSPTNDQIDLNKNDLSHEADYKLSRLEQEQNDEMDHGPFWSTYNSRESEKSADHNWKAGEKKD